MKLIKTIGGFIMKHERILLTIVTIGAEGIAIYEGLKQGPVFDEVLEKVKNDEMTKKEAAKELALPAVKVAVPFAISGTAAILNHKKASDTIQSLSSLIMLSKEANDFKDAYKQQVAKEFGPEKAEEFEKNIYRDRVKADYAREAIEYIPTGHGNGRFYEAWSGRYFLSDINYIKKIENDLNKLLRIEMWVSVNDIYSELGIPRSDCGTNLGWHANDRNEIEFEFDCQMDENDIPYTILRFRYDPEPQWKKMGQY